MPRRVRLRTDAPLAAPTELRTCSFLLSREDFHHSFDGHKERKELREMGVPIPVSAIFVFFAFFVAQRNSFCLWLRLCCADLLFRKAVAWWQEFRIAGKARAEE